MEPYSGRERSAAKVADLVFDRRTLQNTVVTTHSALGAICMIYVLATIEVAANKRDEFLGALMENVPRVQAEDGCLEYQPAIDLETEIAAQGAVRPQVVVVVEKWRDLPALQAHLQAPHMLEYRERVLDLVSSVSLQVLTPAS